MQQWWFRFRVPAQAERIRWGSLLLCMVIAAGVITTPVSAAGRRLLDRSLYTTNNEPGDVSSYTVALRYVSPQAVGSLDMLFCIDPIPYKPCVVPPGLDVSGATLSAQAGESGFTIQSRTANRIVISRPPSMVSSSWISAYTFDNIVNPAANGLSYSIRLKSHASTNASGPQIDFGSVKTQVATGIKLETQVPPMLIFCVAQRVELGCESTNEINYTDMGELDARSTLQAQSQMAVGTNASGGFAITANGIPPSAGTSVIDPLVVPTASRLGANQFGINLVTNTEPAVGAEPEGLWTNAIPASEYSMPNLFKYESGDVVAFSPNVSLMKKFTVSYVVNSSQNLRAGVYSTTITYIASGRF